MVTEVYIVSGFLGAGKTTLIQKIIREAFSGRKIALIENDFGEASIDANLLRNEQFEVTEINSGCICCSLSGDFVKALSELLRAYEPEVIIIEPSGVSKLSDVEKACSEIDQIKIMAKITVVDTKRFQSYYENFGAFYEDQIKNADMIILSHNHFVTKSEVSMSEDLYISRVLESPDQIESVTRMISKLNSQAKIISSPWQHFNIETVLLGEREATLFELCNCHSDQCTCHLNHNAADVFQSCTVTLDRVITLNAINLCFQVIEKSSNMNLVRAKGVLETDQGYLNLQYVQGELKMTPSQYSGNKISFIGRDLDVLTIAEMFKRGCQ